jgi:TonB-linked SusC/RagA family outer membrane protein
VGTVTDALGRFTLPNLDPAAILEITFVGHDAQTFHLKGKTFFTIALGQKLTELDEAVIIAYGKTSRRFTTGNIATVKAADIEKQPVQNPLLALQGRVPGIEIRQLTGINGGGVKVQIQGRNSIQSGSDPLVLVDGMPFPTQLTGSDAFETGMLQGGSPLNYINPDDIESIEILKDADATAIYGSRAANGAILITTKKGKAGRAKLTLNVQQGWSKVANKVDMLNTRQYLDMRYEAFRHAGIIITTPSVSANDLKVWDTTRYTDWQKELIGGTAIYTNLNASISGGVQNLTYMVGATYNRQTTVFPGNLDDKKGTVHFNINGASNNQRLKVQLSGSYMIDENHLPGTDLTLTALLMEPNAPPLYKEDGSLNWAVDSSGKSTWQNPLTYTLFQGLKNTTKNLVSNLNLSFRLLEGLEIRSNLGYTNLVTQIYNPTRLEFYRPENRINEQRVASWGNRNMSSWIIEPMVQYSRSIGHGKLEGLLGTTIQQNDYFFLNINGFGFYTDQSMKTLTAAQSINSNLSTSGLTRYNAVFGRINFNWDDRYLLNLTARRDGSNKYGEKSRFSNFGSVGIGWIFSQEKWIKEHLSSLSFGKIRTSYGITGNDQIGDFSYLSVYSINNPTVLYQNSIGLDASNLPNPYLKWERTTKWQTGIDLGIWQERLLLGVTYARNRSTNQLISYVLPSFSGATFYTQNFPATVQNISWEFVLNTENIKNNNFSWSTAINLTIPRNKLVRFPGIESTSYASGGTGVVVGEPLGVIKTFAYGGINPANGAHVLDPNFKSVYVYPLTVYYGGINNKIVYKGFQLDFLVQFVRKKSIRDFYWGSGAQYPGVFAAGTSNQPITVLNRWQKPGDDATIPPYSTSSYSTSVVSTDAWYSLDASFIRVKNISLSWQLPVSWLKKAAIRSANVYLHTQNVCVITNYLGIDPETGASSMPPLRTLTAGVRLEL